MKSLTFDTSSTTCSSDRVREIANELDAYRSHLKSVVEGGAMAEQEAFLNTPSDTIALSIIEEAIAHFQKNPPKFVVVIGIGGSNLGRRQYMSRLVECTALLQSARNQNSFFSIRSTRINLWY
jgi:glucose-6-phosphate isomerase